MAGEEEEEETIERGVQCQVRPTPNGTQRPSNSCCSPASPLIAPEKRRASKSSTSSWPWPLPTQQRRPAVRDGSTGAGTSSAAATAWWQSLSQPCLGVWVQVLASHCPVARACSTLQHPHKCAACTNRHQAQSSAGAVTRPSLLQASNNVQDLQQAQAPLTIRL